MPPLIINPTVLGIRCDVGWGGDHCEHIMFGASRRCESGGLCLDGADGFTSTWGGEAALADDSSYHIYAAGFAGPHLCHISRIFQQENVRFTPDFCISNQNFRKRS